MEVCPVVNLTNTHIPMLCAQWLWSLPLHFDLVSLLLFSSALSIQCCDLRSSPTLKVLGFLRLYKDEMSKFKQSDQCNSPRDRFWVCSIVWPWISTQMISKMHLFFCMPMARTSDKPVLKTRELSGPRKTIYYINSGRGSIQFHHTCLWLKRWESWWNGRTGRGMETAASSEPRLA